MQTVIDIQAVDKRYGTAPVINHCSLKIQEGEIYGLLGVNGAGKTTLMKLILGLQRPDRGSIRVLGQDIRGGPAYLANVGSVIETPAFYEYLTAGELLSMHLGYMRKKADIAETLRLVGLERAAQKPVSQYSLGMKQRLGLARAIIHRPKLLILDEPLNGLDPVAIQEMRELLKTLKRGGTSILLASHIIGEIQHTADRVGILSGGYIKQEFAAAEKAAEYGERFEDYVIGIMRGN